MAARNIFRVVPSGKMWEVRKDGLVLSEHLQLDLAVQNANVLANEYLSSRVVIHRIDGSIYKPFIQ